MPFRRHHNSPVVTETTKPTLLTRLRGRNSRTQTVKTTTTVEPNQSHGLGSSHNHNHNTRSTGIGAGAGAGAGGVGTGAGVGVGSRNNRTSRWGRHRRGGERVVRQRRHASIGDKISGAMLRLKGSLTGRPGVKAAGTRRMEGTDGRGAHRAY